MSVTATQFALLQNRVTAIDGVGAQVPSQSAVPVIATDLNGLHETINQLTLAIQTQLNTVLNQLISIQGAVNNLLGVSGGNQAARTAFTTAGTTGTIDIRFITPYPDNNYTAVVSIEPAAATFPVSVQLAGFIRKPDFSGVTVMYTAASSALPATAHVIARHD